LNVFAAVLYCIIGKKKDNPWIEHSRWNPKCVFVLLSKGNQFVENVVKKYGKIIDICECDCGSRSYDTVV